MKRMKKTKSDLVKEYRKLAKRADQRLVRLERYMKRPGMAEIEKGAYARAMKDIEVWSGRGKKRFNTAPPMPLDAEGGLEALQAKINDIQAFLRADTSTLAPGIDTRGFSISSYEKMAQSFNAAYGTDLTWQEIGSFYQSKKYKKLSEKIQASKTIAIALGVFDDLRKQGKTRRELMDEIRAQGKHKVKKGRQSYWEYQNAQFTDDEAVNEIVNKMIKMGINPQTMFKGR